MPIRPAILQILQVQHQAFPAREGFFVLRRTFFLISRKKLRKTGARRAKMCYS
jgi:hypothetical protein